MFYVPRLGFGIWFTARVGTSSDTPKPNKKIGFGIWSTVSIDLIVIITYTI